MASRQQEKGDQNMEQGRSRQPGTTKSSGGAQAQGQTDRERSLDTTRDSEGRGRQRAGLARPDQSGGLYSPFGLVSRMMEDMDRMFSGFGLAPIARSSLTPRAGRGREPAGDGLRTIWAPEIELFRRGDELVVRADLPGLKKDDVNIEVEDDVLTISGERRHEFEDESDGVFRSERSYGTFYRSIPLPEGTNPDDAKASFGDGVLEVRVKMPKEQQRQAKRIQIG